MKDDRPTVYSTEWNDPQACDRCHQNPCVCKKTVSLAPKEQTAFIRRETKGRGGKTVVTISNLVLTDKDMKALAKKLKKSCGTGGTIKDGTIEIQGDHREKIAAELTKKGFKIKFTGG